jgi:ubiquinone/menaquinone biosynthesis C-methylase UbiE
VLGIPDFRVYPDPYIDYESDREKGKRLANCFNDLDFEGLVKFYWEITPSTPKDLASRYVRYALTGVQRGYDVFQSIKSFEEYLGKVTPDLCLDIGCGAGGFLVAASNQFKQVVGIDIAFRWLIVARKRIAEANLQNIKLLCCCAEYLPLPDNVFDLVVATDVLEHAKYQGRMVKESHRVLKSWGSFYYSTTNRFTLTPELHVRVWGLGFLPRKWMQPYVKFVKGIPYKHIRSLSYFELRKILQAAQFWQHKMTLPTVSNLNQNKFSVWERFQIIVYMIFRKLPLVNRFLYLFGPFLSGMCKKDLTKMEISNKTYSLNGMQNEC